MRRILCLSLCSLVILLFVAPLSVRAQETVEPVINSQVIDPNKLPALTSTYFGQLENYRNQEQNYLVAVNQYHQLNTLASQEVAVAETRQLLSLRADVLLTYLEILDEQLNQGKGIPLENKAPERVSLTLLREKVQTHRSSVQAAQDRFAVDTEAQNFLTTYNEIQSHTYYILSLIKLGDMQVAFDKTQLARNAVKTYVEALPLSTAVRAEKQRGFDEIERNIQNIEIIFTPLKSEVYTSPGSKDLSQYSQLSSRLSPVYAQINQVIQFLEEVRK